MGTGSIAVIRRPGRGVDHPPSSPEVKERVELYLYHPPFWTLVACSRVKLRLLPLQFRNMNVTARTFSLQLLPNLLVFLASCVSLGHICIMTSAFCIKR